MFGFATCNTEGVTNRQKFLITRDLITKELPHKLFLGGHITMAMQRRGKLVHLALLPRAIAAAISLQQPVAPGLQRPTMSPSLRLRGGGAPQMLAPHDCAKAAADVSDAGASNR